MEGIISFEQAGKREPGVKAPPPVKPTAQRRKAAQTKSEGKVKKEPLTSEQVKKLMEQALENA